tara:strand:+ start:4296 stop:4961 length:666 start_codon:yes stop_codon:yes gene_type:complete
MEQTIKPHKEIMAEADSMTATAGVRQKGNKMYLEVKHRITILRRHYAIALGIDTTLLEANDKYVRVQAKIADPDGRVIASGMAEEIRGKGLVNQTSALENAETSAVGRALASLGLHGGEYASANEMDAVVRKTEIQKQETPKPMPDDPIPNGNAAEFHPSSNWDAWIGIAKADIEKFSSSGDTMSWFEKNREYLKDLEKENITKHAELAELWSDKHERMNT